MKRYSPRPQDDYLGVRADGTTYGPAAVCRESGPGQSSIEAAWNLVWLTFPEVDDYLPRPQDEARLTARLPDGLVRRLIVGTLALSRATEGRIVYRFAEAMRAYPNPLDFVDYVQRHPRLGLLPWYREFGEAWLATLTARAKFSVYGEAADALLVVDFKRRRPL